MAAYKEKILGQHTLDTRIGKAIQKLRKKLDLQPRKKHKNLSENLFYKHPKIWI